MKTLAAFVLLSTIWNPPLTVKQDQPAATTHIRPADLPKPNPSDTFNGPQVIWQPEDAVLHVPPDVPMEIGPGATIAHSVVFHGASVGAEAIVGNSSTVLDMAEIARDPHYRARQILTTVGDVVMQGPVARLSRTPAVLRHPGRRLDADGDEVRRSGWGPPAPNETG